MNISHDALKRCETGSKGIELQIKAERLTHRIARPYPAFIPTIVFNNVSINFAIKKLLVSQLQLLFSFHLIHRVSTVENNNMLSITSNRLYAPS